MAGLSNGEWRLFLLSDCLKFYREVQDATAKRRELGKQSVLEITGKECAKLNKLLDKEDVDHIRGELQQEWVFTHKVVDNGAYNYTTCEYCQQQEIRYRYLCVNEINKTWLSLGSVCVGRIVHGEHAMENKDFSTGFVKDLDKMKGKATKDDPSVEKPKQEGLGYHEVRRKEQIQLVGICTKYLSKYGKTANNDTFLKDLHERWIQGKSLTDNQIEGLKKKCSFFKQRGKEKVPQS